MPQPASPAAAGGRHAAASGGSAATSRSVRRRTPSKNLRYEAMSVIMFDLHARSARCAQPSGYRGARCIPFVTLRRRSADSYNGSAMGTFAVKFVASHPLMPERRLELEGLVDTGALFTQIPEETLAGIGITPS